MSPFQLSLSELANTISKQAFSRKKTLKRQLRLAAACAKLNLAPQTSGLSFEERQFGGFRVRSERRIERESLLISVKCRSEQKSFNNQFRV